MNILVDITKAKSEATGFLNHLITDYNLPSVVIEGIFNGLLSEIRNQELIELTLAQQEEAKKEEK